MPRGGGTLGAKVDAEESGRCCSLSPGRIWPRECPESLPRLRTLPGPEQVNEIPAQPKLINAVFFSSFFRFFFFFEGLFFQP